MYREVEFGMGRIFSDEAHQAQFERSGYLVVRLLAEEDAAKLRDEIDESRAHAVGEIGSHGGLEQSFCTPNARYRQRAHEIVASALGEPLLALLRGYRLAASGVMTKLPGASPMDVHRDRTCLPDPDEVAVNAWCPLVDIGDGENEGNLAMLPGSHKLPNVETTGVESFYSGYGAALKKLCISHPLKAGEAILFDHRLLHWSRSNRDGGVRPVARAMAVPADSRLVHYRLESGSGGRRFELLDVEADGPVAHSPDDVAQGLVAAPVIGHAENRNRDISYRECRSRAAEATGSDRPALGLWRLGSALRGLRSRERA